MAEITFLAPGSCQLEVTAQGNVGTDTGVDLASVSWTIEQALIAGCRFSPSAGDVHIDRNGVLTIGRSLFDRINQAADDDAIPGQCTLVIRADSTITKTVLDRFKVLVGYPGEGGGGGGVTLGNPQMPPFSSSSGEPQIGDDIPEQSLAITNLSIGDSVVLTKAGDNILSFESYERIAAGVTIVVDIPAEYWPANTDAKIYRATIDLPTHKYSNVELTDTVVTATDVTIDGTAYKRASFVLPEVEDVTNQVNVFALVSK